MTPTADARLIVRKEGPIAWILFSNPNRLNAVTMDMWLKIPRLAREFAEDPAIRVIVFRGEGERAFISGADISEFDGNRASLADIRAYDVACMGALEAISRHPKPTVAMISGYCIGGGLALALSCDLRIAAEDSRMGIPAAKLGIAYPVPALWRHCEVVGPSRTKELLFTGDIFSAPQALQMGLVNRLEKPGELEKATQALASRIASNAPLTIAASKTAIDEFSKDVASRDLAACDAAIERCMVSQDYVEGRLAFAQKRPPVFEGR